MANTKSNKGTTMFVIKMLRESRDHGFYPLWMMNKQSEPIVMRPVKKKKNYYDY